MAWDYNPDGSLKTRSDDGVPVGKAVALVDNSDTQNITFTGTWATSSTGTGHQGYDYRTHAAGTGTNSVAWKAVVPQDGNYTVSVRYPAGPGAATNATYKVDFAGGSRHQDRLPGHRRRAPGSAWARSRSPEDRPPRR